MEWACKSHRMKCKLKTHTKVEKKELSSIVGGNINWYSHHGKQYRSSLKKLKIEFPCDPPIPLLGIYPDKTIIQKDTCTHLFIAALSAIAKTWKQPKCPSTDEWIKKMRHMCTMEYHSAVKRWNNAICSNIDGPGDYYTKWSKSGKRQIPYDITYT